MADPGTVFIVDDDAAVLDALQSLFHSRGLRTTGFADAETYLQAVSPAQPGVLVVDVRMPGMSGLELLQQAVAEGRSRTCIVLSGHGEIPVAVRAMQLGALTFLEKPVSHQELLEAVRQGWSREQQRTQVTLDRQFVETAVRRLTTDEMLVLREIMNGRTNVQVAAALDISLRTVQFRLSDIYEKFSVRCKSDLVQRLRRVGWEPPAAVRLQDQ